MAPKKRPGRAKKTVVTSTKVVEETVKVVVTPGGSGGEDDDNDNNESVEMISSSTKQNTENVEIFTSSPEKEHVLRTIPVEDKEEQIPAPDIVPQEQDEDETQPYSEPETASTPPRKEAPPPKSSEPLETPPPAEKRETRKKKFQEKAKEAGQEKKATTEKLRPKRRRRSVAGAGAGESYKRYVFKVMKQVHPEMGISSKAMTIVNNLMTDMFERFAEEAARLQKYTGRKTMSSREVQGAVKLVLPGELGKHAVAEGAKAVTNYVSYVPKS
ncbi:hypothetical protein ABFS82_14G237600 [Erythranthe guttata]|uniref:Core Histone H2A/H2B/H3 domain-containing protein n=1 Tax=Erythranthe guttata TaxID=4155 RepID=A0A022R8Q6_ERYGU|nr:PREDICTED: probable histone H2B.3 [Erythranthe guttata]XP_012838321.1 PREDICTED: probable histone H2B.3 [Erythranthe guttata]EYU36118.1 hypothetical protein MIMGU_mgv1a011789mg [Erythranthe guttata]|eukprot:XP_012838320.1 PREDICTED: probable histone H2B.3 [Erythranthe guttata]